MKGRDRFDAPAVRRQQYHRAKVAGCPRYLLGYDAEESIDIWHRVDECVGCGRDGRQAITGVVAPALGRRLGFTRHLDSTHRCQGPTLASQASAADRVAKNLIRLGELSPLAREVVASRFCLANSLFGMTKAVNRTPAVTTRGTQF